MSDVAFVEARTTPAIRFEAAPVLNVLCSMCMLGQEMDRISAWVDRTKGALGKAARETGMLACEAPAYVGESWSRPFDEWLEELDRRDPREIFRLDAERLAFKAALFLPGRIPDAGTLVTDRRRYLDLVKRLCDKHEEPCDIDKVGSCYDKMKDGPQYRDELASALRSVWDDHLRDEWRQVEPTVKESVQAFRSVTIPGRSIEERLRFVLDRDYVPEEWLPIVERVGEVVFVPSVHIGPYMVLFHHDRSRAWIVGRARIPAGATTASRTLSRSELLIRLDAMSDAGRLAILEMAARRGEVTTQLVMDELELSQSSASRHLTHLAATGLLHVNASERTKRYTVNYEKIDDLLAGIRGVVETDSARAGSGGRGNV